MRTNIQKFSVFGFVSCLVALCVLFSPRSILAAARSGSIRGHSVGGGGTHHSVRFHSRFGFYGYYYLPYYYPFGYYYSPYPAYYGYGSAYPPDVAYLDTDISPEKAAVYLDGEYMGVADDYDGFPQYLTVRPGRHSITFKAEGHKTVTRSVRVPRGAVLDLEFTLPKGSGVEEPKGPRVSQNGREGENEGDDEDEIVVPEQRQGQAPPGAPGAYEGEQGEGSGEGDDEAEENRGQGRDEREDESGPGFVRLEVTPLDASIYIDGRLYGSASRLARLHGDLRLEVGHHRIEAVRPGYRAVTREVDVKPGGHISLDIDLARGAARPNPPK